MPRQTSVKPTPIENPPDTPREVLVLPYNSLFASEGTVARFYHGKWYSLGSDGRGGSVYWKLVPENRLSDAAGWVEL